MYNYNKEAKLKIYISCAIIFGIFIGSGNLIKADIEKILPIYSVNTEEKQIALTFDVAWGDEDFEDVMRVLEENEVKATFFLVGDWAKKFPEHVKTLAEKGHDIGNHSNTHPHVTKMTKAEIETDIKAAHEIVKEITGLDMDLYRPPYGEYNNDVIKAAEACKYFTIQWDVDSLDWKEYGKQPLIDKVLKHKNLTHGSIVLLHTGTKHTKDALEEIIKGLKQKGYEIVPTSQMIMREDYKVDHTGRQFKL
ncbi:MAG: hypothetical protein ATN36_05040 [Epulopiscium sp. Nele67-Bin005]|nr:MAG: hypothetical protein ATN36_05040 [Epulopiscium sp. Nele67-Bin005]